MSEDNLVAKEEITKKIYAFRNTKVMIDSDLAKLCGVTTKALNQAAKRNKDRFPEDFMFQLNDYEKQELVTNCDRFKTLKHSNNPPIVFTEQGVAMLSGILKSQRAIGVNIYIMRAFVAMRHFVQNNADLFVRVDVLENKQIETDKNVKMIFDAISNRPLKKQGVFYDGQMFDAYLFINDLLKKAKESIILIDNYIDESVLVLFSCLKGIPVTIYTDKITEKLKLDLEKYNSQYSNISLKQFTKSHDRFLILDKKEIYHLGASIKDLGKKWFAFSKLDKDSLTILGRLD